MRSGKEIINMKTNLIKISDSFFVEPLFQQHLAEIGMTSMDAVFSFDRGQTLDKKELAGYRTRIQFEAGSPPVTLFLKRYDNPPVLTQLKNWLCHRVRISFGDCDCLAAENLEAKGINTPKTIAKGRQWSRLFEKRSFSITKKIPGHSLEEKLPDYFENRKLKNNFIDQLAQFIKKFHQSGYRHRDLYLCHIFHDDSDFYLIDLARAFKPIVFSKRYRVKDIAQLYYSAPGRYFSKADRLRFYLAYAGCDKLRWKDKLFISAVKAKANKMAKHDAKRGKAVPFMC